MADSLLVIKVDRTRNETFVGCECMVSLIFLCETKDDIPEIALSARCTNVASI